jgi:hypothetical protein
MKRTSATLAVIVTATLIAAGCGGGNQQNTSDTSTSGTPAQAPSSPPAGASTASQDVDVTFRSEPDPPKMGENTFDVMVMSGGQPVTDADVSVEFFMAAMPEMKMPEMRNTVPLKHEGGGRATVTVRRNGQVVGSEKFPVTAK